MVPAACVSGTLMAFITPTFNLTANYWTRPQWLTTWPGVVAAPSLALFAAAVRGLERAPVQGGIGFGIAYPVQILCAKGTNVQGPTFDHADTMLDWPIIEIPSGSSQFYFVVQVADVAKGYPNEYRSVWCYPAQNAKGADLAARPGYPWVPPWPVPYT